MSIESQYPQLNDEAWLRQRYVIDRQSQVEIAREVGCHHQSVSRALKRFQIASERRGREKYPQLRNRDWLERELQTKTIRQIAEEQGCSATAIFWAARRHGITIPDRAYEISPEGRARREAGFRAKYPNGRWGDQASNWRGGRRKQSGYWLVYKPDHPRAGKRGAVQEHILIVEKARGYPLAPNEVVHHKNHIKDDNRIENLVVKTVGTHLAEHIHAGQRVEAAEAEAARLRAENEMLRSQLEANHG